VSERIRYKHTLILSQPFNLCKNKSFLQKAIVILNIKFLGYMHKSDQREVSSSRPHRVQHLGASGPSRSTSILYFSYLSFELIIKHRFSLEVFLLP
jgi:hypothetical protein